MSSNFQAMSQKELHDYVLTHRDDQDAFYAYVDKLHAEGNWIEMPPLKSEQDLDNYPEFIVRVEERKLACSKSKIFCIQ